MTIRVWDNEDNYPKQTLIAHQGNLFYQSPKMYQTANNENIFLFYTFLPPQQAPLRQSHLVKSLSFQEALTTQLGYGTPKETV